MAILYIGLDDTDNLESRGTGHLARQIAGTLSGRYRLLGVTRHQLLVDPRVPCTKNNSCACIMFDVEDAGLDPLRVEALLRETRQLMLDDFQPGSDPGLCLAGDVPPAITAFGRQAQRQLVSQQAARALAQEHTIPLLGLGGDEDGVIGALAAVGLAASGEDGRYVLVGRSRELKGLQPVPALLQAGIAAVETSDGQAMTEGLVLCDKLRPARRRGQAIAVVEWQDGHWLPLKLD